MASRYRTVFLLLAQLLPEVRCADGWASPSIDSQGACSHHGGVKGNGIYLLAILGISTWLGMFVSRKTERKLKDSEWFPRTSDFLSVISTETKDGMVYLAIGLFLSSFVLFNEKAVPVLIVGIIYLIAGITKLVKRSRD